MKRYCNYKTDAPTNFAIASSYLDLGLALGRETTHHIQPFELFHNGYFIYTGPSGRTRKSTSQYIATTELLNSEWILPNDIASQEALVEELSDRNRGVQPMPEFSKLLKGIRRQSYDSTLAETYNELISCHKYDRKLKTRQGVKTRFVIEKPYFSFVSTCTNEVLQESLTIEAMHGGQMARVINASGFPKDRPRGRLPPQATILQEQLKEELTFLDTTDKSVTYFELSDEALNYYNNVIVPETRTKEFESVQPCAVRILDYVVTFADLNLISEAFGVAFDNGITVGPNTSLVKLVELVTLVKLVEYISEYDNSDNYERTSFGYNVKNVTNDTNATNLLIVTQKIHLQRAWEFLKPCLKNMAELATYVELDKPIAKIRKYIKEKGSNGVKAWHSDMMRYCNVNKTECDRAIDTLENREEIRILGEEGTGKKYYIWLGGVS